MLLLRHSDLASFGFGVAPFDKVFVVVAHCSVSGLDVFVALLGPQRLGFVRLNVGLGVEPESGSVLKRMRWCH